MPRVTPMCTLLALLAGAPALAAPPRGGPAPAEVRFTQYHQFARVQLKVPPWRSPEDRRVTAALPAPLRAAVMKALSGLDELRRLAGARWNARGARYGCDEPCPKQKELDVALQRAEDALDSAAKRAEAQRNAAVAACEKALGRKPSGAVALALARLHEVDSLANDITADNHPAEADVEYGEPLGERHGASQEILEAYRKAAAATAPRDEVGAWARHGLAGQLWMKGDAAAARDELAALLPAAPAAWRGEVAFRLGVAQGALGDDRAAVAAFGQALAAAGPGDADGWRQLRVAALAAAYRAGEHRAALARAIELLQEASPTGRRRILELLRGGSGHPHVVRIAADCVERLGRAQADLSRATPATVGSILARLALRELYRGDRPAAAATVAAALARVPAAAPVRTFLVDLGALARGPLDEAGRKRVRGELASQLRGRAFAISALGAFGAARELPLEEEELEAVLAPEKTPAPERRVRSLLRLCLEPAAGWLSRRPEGRGESTLELRTRVDRGRTVVDVTLPNERELEPTGECVAQMGRRILPAPLHATVDLTNAGVTASQLKWREQVRKLGKERFGLEGALGGRGLGGVGGLGTRGAAGAGGGGAIGIGGLGTRGRGAGGLVKGAGGAGRPARGRDADRLLRKLKGTSDAADQDRGRREALPPEPPQPLPSKDRR